MTQIMIIHGGNSFSSYDAYINDLTTKAIDYDRLKLQKTWKPWIAEQMAGYDVLLPTFPNSQNAVYDEWVLYFEKLLPFLHDDVRLIGHSLGAMFLAKYLHDHTLDQKVTQLILVAGHYGSDDDTGSFAVQTATNIDKSAEEVHLFHSQDDPVVDYTCLDGYINDLPQAHVHRFAKRGHFNEETFPELLALLKQK